MWAIPLPAGEPRRLGDAEVTSASIFPDGRLAYVTNAGTFTAEKDGSNPHKIEGLHSYYAPVVSPDGKRFAFTSYDKAAKGSVISESASDGTGIHEVARGGTGNIPAEICCPRWTSDGKFLLFEGDSGQGTDLWTVAGRAPILRRDPVIARLTNGPLSFTDFAASRDGEQIFAIGSQRRGGMGRVDPPPRDFVAFFGGNFGLYPTISPHGERGTYL